MGNRILFWVRMHDVQDGLGVEDISDLIRKEIHEIFETKNPTKDQIRKYKRPEENSLMLIFYTYVRSDLMLRIIKNCRGEKVKDGKKIDSFRSKLGFKLHDITMSKEKSVTTKIIKIFSNEKTLP